MEMDEIDQYILTERQEKWDAIKGVRPGDWCVLPDGSERRFADTGHSLESKSGEGGPGSFYLTQNGQISYSGGHDFIGWFDTQKGPNAVRTQQQQETKPGSFWFFHHDQKLADNDVIVSIPCRVFKYVPAAAT
jgi:hypothetical protein